MMDKVKQKLSCMESLRGICRVKELTDWCAGIVIVVKKMGAMPICVDLTKLNKSVCQEKFILPSVEATLGIVRPQFLVSWMQIWGFGKFP